MGDLPTILQHELMEISLRGGNKPGIADVLTSDIKFPTQVTLEQTSCLVVDGQAEWAHSESQWVVTRLET